MPQTVKRHEEEHLYADPPESEGGRALAAALLRFCSAARVQEHRALGASGLPNLDFRALRYLVQGERDGRELGVKDLTVMLGTSSANTTKVLDRLERGGYVERANHPTDRRARRLRPTETAVHKVDETIGRYHALLVAEIDRLADEQAASVAEPVDRIAAALEA